MAPRTITRLKKLVGIAAAVVTMSAASFGVHAAPDSISPRVSVSRVSGKAPLLVFFDATETTDTDTTKPIHQLTYCFDAGDGNVARYSLAGHKTTPKATFCGAPLYSYVYETPGTYTASISVHAADGDVAVRTYQITVGDYSGSETACVSASGNFTGCPAGAARIVSADYSANANARLRVLYRCNESFAQSRTIDLSVDGSFVGAYNDSGVVKGRDCRYTVSGSRGYDPFYINADDIRIMGGSRTGNGQETFLNFLANNVVDPDHILVQNWNIDNMGSILIALEYGQQGSELPRFWGFFGVQSNGCGRLSYCFFTVLKQFAVVDTVLDGAVFHTIRLGHGEDTFIHNTKVSGYGIHGITIRGLGDNNPDGYVQRWAENNFISDSWVVGDEVWPLQNGAGNGSSRFVRVRNNIVERTYFTTPSVLSGIGDDLRTNTYIETGSSGSTAQISDMTYRNNVFDMRNSSPGAFAISTGSNNVGVEVYGNSGFSDGQRRLMVGNGACSVLQGNVFWESGGIGAFPSGCSNISGNYDGVGGMSGVQALQTCPFAVCPPVRTADFSLSAAFTSAATRTATTNLLDFNQARRAWNELRLPGAITISGGPAPVPVAPQNLLVQ